MQLPSSAEEFEEMIYEAEKKTRDTKQMWLSKKQFEEVRKLHRSNKNPHAQMKYNDG